MAFGERGAGVFGKDDNDFAGNAESSGDSTDKNVTVTKTGSTSATAEVRTLRRELKQAQAKIIDLHAQLTEASILLQVFQQGEAGAFLSPKSQTTLGDVPELIPHQSQNRIVYLNRPPREDS